MSAVRKRFPVLKAIVATAAVVAFVVLVRVLPVAEWLAAFQTWVRGAGALGYVLYALVYVVCCVLVVPALALTLGAGAIFGFVAGSIIVLIGATLGATAAFLLARTVLRHRIERMTAGNEKFRALDRAITREGTKIMWLVRLSGFPPFTWVNYAFGLTGIHLTPFVVTTFFGIIPGTLAFTWAGAAGAAALSGTGNRILLIVTAAGAVLVSVFIARVALRAIRRAGVEE
ncbi:MAG TPA: VTT domain-containing protein [Thermoanaerobaculia bacterium]|nr:VTT domain-containing protein [Thermoanaerobaculia bacterium]